MSFIQWTRVQLFPCRYGKAAEQSQRFLWQVGGPLGALGKSVRLWGIPGTLGRVLGLYKMLESLGGGAGFRSSSGVPASGLTHQHGGSPMPGVIRTLAFAILQPSRVQPEHGLLGGSRELLVQALPPSLLSLPPSLTSSSLTSSRWPTSTNAQIGWKAPVPQASKWVWL